MLLQTLWIISWPSVNSNWSYSPETLNLGQNRQFFCPVWLWYLNRWPWKTIAHLFYVTLSFVHHFIVIGEFKLESHSGNTQIGARFVLTSVTLTFDFWPGPFAWTSLLSMVIAPENSWWYDGRNIVQKVSDVRTDRSVLRAVWLQLKIVIGTIFVESQWFIRTIKILKGHLSLNSM